jgi:hypothetical protein
MTMSYDNLNDNNDVAEVYPQGVTKNGSKALLYFYKSGRVLSSDMPEWSGLNQGQIHPLLNGFLQEYHGSRPPTFPVNGQGREAHGMAKLSTEYTRGGTIFRAHPNYRQKGPWYDWAMIRWAKEDGQRAKSRSKEDSCVHYGDDGVNTADFTYAPGKILGFIFDHNNVQAVVLCCDASHSKSSVFTTHWKLSFVDKAFTKPLISLVNVDAIVRHCLMIPENDEAHGFHEVWSRERWADEFHC